VSCSSAGYCAVGGQNGAYTAFVASQRHGAWGPAVTPAGLPASYSEGSSGAMANAVACPPAITLCVAGGFYTGPRGGQRAFLVSQRR
jgi:hypothetical protein